MTYATNPGVELRTITKTYGSKDVLFRDFSLEVPQGQSLAIVGASGSGKSTLLNIASLLEEPNAGEVWISGERKDTSSAGSLSLGYIFQRDALLPWSTVLENVLLGLKCRGIVNSEQRDRAINILEDLGLVDYLERYPAALSGGQKQLVAIAQNLILEPSLLFLDEPSSSLDFQNKLLLEQRLLHILQRREQKLSTSVLVTHDIEEALVMADRVVVLGRRSNQPAIVALDIKIPVSLDQRDPIAARQSNQARQLFQEIWHAIRPFVNGSAHDTVMEEQNV